MTSEEPISPVRRTTDDRLRNERTISDEAIATSFEDDAECAEEVLSAARTRADAVLATARSLADEKWKADDPLYAIPAILVLRRAVEDSNLRWERAKEDGSRRRQRRCNTELKVESSLRRREQTDRSLERERETADRRLGYRDDFLAMVNHDLRSLLCGVLLEAGELSSTASESEEGLRVVAGMGRIERYVARMNALIGDLVDVQSIDAGELMISPIEWDTTALLSETVETFFQSATQKEISLSYDTSNPPLTGVVDPGRIVQVLSNLVSNSLKFTPPGGEIVLQGGRREDGLLLSVRDTGIGIPSDQVGSIFKRFWKGSEDDSNGLGLGLYISSCIVESHHGKMWVESEEGRGSTFFVSLPGNLSHPLGGE